MAEFVQTMKDWRRMCSACTCSNKEDMKDYPLCPIIMHHTGYPCDECPQDWSEEATQKFEEIVMSWAAEHPVVYPTWYEWLTSIGAVTRKVKPDVASALIETGLLDPIHADIAQKLGVEPKEGT